MAVLIHKEPDGDLLSAYNNSIIEFGTDTGTAARALLVISGIQFEVSPIAGKFYFNLREIVKILINTHAFADRVTVTNANAVVYPDPDLYLEVDVDFIVIRSNGVRDEFTKGYKFLKSAIQLYRNPFDEPTGFRFLVPWWSGWKVTYFEGLPFDFALYSDADREYEIKNLRTGQTKTINAIKGVNRIFISNGENDGLGFEQDLPLVIGTNILSITGAGNTAVLEVTKKPVGCGKYLKFLNQRGGWSYWRHEPVYKETIKTKKLGHINADFNNLGNTNAPTLSTGKEAVRQLELITGKMDMHERIMMESIYLSPKVYLYGNKELQPFDRYDWIELDVSDGTNTVLHTKRDSHNFKVTVNLPKMYNQTFVS